MVQRKSTVYLGVVLTIVLTLCTSLILDNVLNLGHSFIFSFPVSVLGVVLGFYQILGEDGDESVEINQHVQHHNSTSMTIEKPDGGTDWSEKSDEEIAGFIKSSPDWRAHEDSKFRGNRNIAKTIHRISQRLQNTSYVDQRIISLSILALSALGGLLTFLIFVKLIGSTWSQNSWITAFANISPFSISMQGGFLFLVPAMVLLIGPIAYLEIKSKAHCPNCGSEFSTTSDGRFYRPHKDVRETDQGTKYNGHRVLRCENCGEIEIEQVSWERNTK